MICASSLRSRASWSAELRQLCSRRQLAVPQQIGDFLKRRVIREFMNIDPAVGQNSILAVDVTNRRRAGNHILQANIFRISRDSQRSSDDLPSTFSPCHW